MKKTFKKFVNDHSLIIVSVIYLFTRLTNLTKLPVFNDEAIYLDWGWKSLHTSAGLFYSLYDAKPPLLIWIFGIFESLVNSPLFAGRLVSVLAGLLTLIGIYKIAKNLEGEKAAVLSSVFYIAIPLFTFFDRQALMESAVAAAGVWSFYFLLQILESKKDRYLIYLGLTFGIGIFVKLQALVFLVSIILILICKKLFKKTVFSTVVGITVLSPLLLQKAFWNSFNSNNRFMLSIPEVLSFPFPLWIKNVSVTVSVLFFHLTPFILILAIYGIILFIRKKKSVLPVFSLINTILILILGRSLNPRYLLSFLVFVPIFCSVAILKFQKTLSFLVGGAALLPAAAITALLIFSPIAYFNFLDKLTVTSQKDGYMNNWTSGYGIPETVNYLENISRDTQIIVGVRIDAGNPESAMFTYFNNSKNIKVIYLDPRVINPELLKLPCLPSNMPVYFATRDGMLGGLDKFFHEVVRFGKPEGERFISINVLNKCN